MPSTLATSLGNANSNWVSLGQGLHQVVFAGTFGGGTYKLQTSPDGGTSAVDITDTICTSPNSFALTVGEGVKFRVNGTGGTGNAVTVTAHKVE